ncbi:hypothetical protein N7478_008778 [Penicillium angulare]|uniref:uncharacterized protein n=1 Tax=Penicillium angulare TaxID=116970 RepID=UPI00254223E5|nr:uncharacterized protein N7478_008778 [Penicillium angulare]KAJ5273653.1 hypothetical protein N7478_008778 [Penicillium angulare]
MTRRTQAPSSQTSASSGRKTPSHVHLSFFDRFPAFEYDDTQPVISEFSSLSLARGWKNGSKTWKKNWKLCMSEFYDNVIGAHINDPETWQQLCHKLDIEGDLGSITKCKKALAKVHVNIVDLLECWTKDHSPRIFRNKAALANYTKQNNRFFSRDLAKQDKLLRVLLRRLV